MFKRMAQRLFEQCSKELHFSYRMASLIHTVWYWDEVIPKVGRNWKWSNEERMGANTKTSSILPQCKKNQVAANQTILMPEAWGVMAPTYDHPSSFRCSVHQRPSWVPPTHLLIFASSFFDGGAQHLVVFEPCVWHFQANLFQFVALKVVFFHEPAHNYKGKIIEKCDPL